MPAKKVIEKHLKAHSFSIEDEIYEKFRIRCKNNNTTLSREIREYIIKWLAEDDKNAKT